MKTLRFCLPFAWVTLVVVACSSPAGPDTQTPIQLVNDQQPAFAKYWYAGKAEISRYTLEQAQYGDLNPGEAIMVFVTEDFLTDKQVKLESARTNDATSVLKLNFIRRFVTGIYDYSVYTSVFTPVQADQFPYTLKTTMSAQDWCGQVYTQLNFRKNGYQVTSRSYFQQESDEDYALDKSMLEDELWNRIRLNPKTLPMGEVRIIPNTAVARLRHQRLQPEAALASLAPYQGTHFAGAKLSAYTIHYPATKRTLVMVFENAFPYRISGWEDTYETGGKVLTSRAVRTNTLQTDYWVKHAVKDSTWRRQLGVRMDLQE